MSASSGTILIVDDDDSLRRLMSRVLGRAGHRVLDAGSVGEASGLARGSALAIDLLVVDAHLPDGGAGDAVAGVRAVHPRARVLCVSGAAAEEAHGFLAAGTGGRFLAKPFSPAVLVAVVAELLAQG